MSAGAFAAQFVTALWREIKPFSQERRALRKARRKRCRGKELTTEEEAILMAEKVTVTLPDGSTIEREEPIIKARTSTKVAGVGAAAMIATAGAFIPFYDEINAAIVQACQSDKGPLAVLIGMGIMLGVNVYTARKTKSPIVPGKI